MAPNNKTRAGRYNWGNLPPHLGCLIKAFGKKKSARRFRYPAEIKNAIMRAHRVYNDEPGMADDAQRWLGSIGVFVQHKPGGGEQSYWYFDPKKEEAVVEFLEQPTGRGTMRIRRPATQSGELQKTRAAILHLRYGKAKKSDGPEVLPMSPQMQRLRREHLERTGEHAAVAVPDAEDEAPEVPVEEAATVADVSAPIADEADPPPREDCASLSIDHTTMRRVLFCTEAEWWTWEHLVLLLCEIVGRGLRVGVGEDDTVLAVDFDLDSADGDKPDLVDCMSAIDRFVEYRLIERLGDSGGGHGTYQFLVDPKAFYVVIIDERLPVSTEVIYIQMVKAMMNSEGPGHNQTGWEVALNGWIARRGWTLNAGTVRNKTCGTSTHPFDPAQPYKRWCIWYRCVLSEGFHRWLLAWPGFTVVYFDSRVSAPRQAAQVAAPAQPAPPVEPDPTEEPELAEESVETPDEVPDAPELEEPAAAAAAETADEPVPEEARPSAVVEDGSAEFEPSANEEPDVPESFEDKLRSERERIREELAGHYVDRMVADQSRLDLDIESLTRRLADMIDRKRELDGTIARVKPLSTRAAEIDGILGNQSLLDFLNGVAAS